MEKTLQIPVAITASEIESIRKDFPILSVKAHGKPLIYFDNAATSQKPKQVIDALIEYYSTLNSNIHRGIHYLSQKASQQYDDTRIKVQKFINASSEREIVFVRGTTEAINLVASSYGRKNIIAGDEILISAMEHHSNIVPWQMLCEEKGAKLKIVPMNDNGEIIIEEFEKLLSQTVKFIFANPEKSVKGVNRSKVSLTTLDVTKLAAEILTILIGNVPPSEVESLVRGFISTFC